MHEAAFNLRRRGLCEPNAYNSLEAASRQYLRSPIVQKWWSRWRKEGKDPAYVALLDGFVAQHTKPPGK